MKRILLVLLLALGVLGADAAAPYVYLLRGDTSHTVGQNSCVLGDNWSDGKAPQADRDYLVDLGDAGSLFAVGATA